jgi:exosortase
MSTLEVAREVEKNKPAAGGLVPRPLVLLTGLLAVACLPALAWHSLHLWSRPHYQFFPLVPVAAAVLAARAVRGLGQLQTGNPRRAWRLLAVGSALLLMAALLYSPWLAAVVTLGLVAVGIYAVGGTLLLGRLFPAWAFLWLMIPPPLNLDGRLVLALQSFATRVTDRVLDVFGVLHVRDGHIIDLPGKRLLVEEACSGIQSLSAILACTLFFLLWKRLPWLRALLLMTAALGWVVLANIARLVVVATFLGRWQVDLSYGWRHEVLGWVLFALALFFTWSTDQLLEFGRAINPFRRKKAAELAEAARPRRVPTRLPDLRPLAPAAWQLALFSLLAVAQVACFWPRTYVEIDGSRIAARLDRFDEAALPPKVGGWERGGFQTKQRERGNWEGENNRSWTYRLAGGITATVAVDHPFSGWHELPVCYQAQGWTAEDIQPQADDGHRIAARFTKPLGRRGYLWYGLFDTDGRPLLPKPPVAHWRQYLRFKLTGALPPWVPGASKTAGGYEWEPTYQTQVLIDTYAPLSPEELTQAQELTREVFLRLGGPADGPR